MPLSSREHDGPARRDNGEVPPAGGEPRGLPGNRGDDSHSNESVYGYLMAYDEALREFEGGFLFDGHPALEGLNRAWDMARDDGDHGLAEHVFGLLEPYLDEAEVQRHAEELERMALGELRALSAQSRDADDVASSITRDFLEVVRNAGGMMGQGAAPSEAGHAGAAGDDEPLGPGSCRFENLVGFEDEIPTLHRYGLGPCDDARRAFIEQMCAQHGIAALPSYATIVFRSPAREDAGRLMLAAAAELDVPTLRMRVDENMMGGSVLCLISSNGFDGREVFTANGFMNAGVLVLEDVDTWVPSFFASVGDLDDAEALAGISRGAQKVLGMIRASVANPNVTVLASASMGLGDGDDLADWLGPMEFVDIYAPSSAERDAIWDSLMDAHPSLSALDRFELVRLTANMPRCDIMAAARESVEQAFRDSVSSGTYKPVTRANVLDKVAAYQPLGSDEYQEIEDSLVEDLKCDLERLDGEAFD